MHLDLTIDRLITFSLLFACSYFYCLANLQSLSNCGTSDLVVNATLAVTNCLELRKSDDEADTLIEASTYGRDGGDCNSMYLCTRGCRYAATNQTCSAICR